MFWFLVAVMIVLFLFMIGWGLYGFRNERQEVEKGLLNSIVYRDQLEELKQDLAKGAITRQAYEEEVEEIRKRILIESETSEPKRIAGPRFITLLLLAVLVPFCALLIYKGVGNPSLLSYSPALKGGASVTAQNSLELTKSQEVNEELLKKFLAESPKDVRAWIQYARVLENQKKWSDALEALDKAFTLNPKVAEEPGMITERALVMAETGDPAYHAKIIEEFGKAIELEPGDQRTRQLAAMMAYNFGEYGKAAEIWSHLLDFYPQGSPQANRLLDAIADAKNRALMAF